MDIQNKYQQGALQLRWQLNGV